MFCAGRVPEEDLKRTMQACGGSIQTSVGNLTPEVLGTCDTFEEQQIGGERWDTWQVHGSCFLGDLSHVLSQSGLGLQCATDTAETEYKINLHVNNFIPVEKSIDPWKMANNTKE